MKAKAPNSRAEIPEPTLIGYFAKPTMKRTEWLNAPKVEEICCFAECQINPLFDWISEWRHNELWVFDSAELAWSVVPEQLRSDCQLFAYRMFPVRYRLGSSEEYQLPPVSPISLDSSFELLGFDLVPRSYDNAFECSPLWCNRLAEKVTANRFCLLDTAEQAFALAPTLEVPGQPLRGEPGPYHIVEVWRQRPA